LRNNGLVITAALGSSLLAEPIQHAFVQPDGDALFAWRSGENGATEALEKIIFGFQFFLNHVYINRS